MARIAGVDLPREKRIEIALTYIFGESLVNEIRACENLGGWIARKFKDYLTYPELADAVDGFVQTESDTEVRKKRIMEAFKALASLT